MTIASEITNYANGLSDAYNAVNDMQGVIPQDKNMNNLDTAIRTIPQNQGATYTAGNGINIDANNEISIDDTVVAEVSDLPTNFTGATSSTAGANGLVPAPTTSDSDKFLKGDGTWATVPAGETTTVFYWNGSAMYKDSGYVTAATISDVETAASAGPVKIYFTSVGRYEYLVFDTINAGGYFSTVWTDINGNLKSVAYTYASNTWTRTSVNVQKQLTASTGISIDASGNISALGMTGATSQDAGSAGLVPAPAAGDEAKALHGDGTWKDTTAKLVEMSYGESNAWTKFINAYNAGSIVYCRASSNANPATGSQTRKAFMAYVNNATSPTSVEFQYVRSQSSKSDSQQTDQVFVYTLTNASGGTWSVASRNMGPKIVAGTGMSSTFTTGANATITLNADSDYSTSEVDTKVKWVDGKTIYRKTINFGALPNASLKTVAHNITNLYRVIKYECMAYNSTSGNNTQIPLVSTVGNNSNLDISSTNVIMNTTTDRSAFDECYITLYYTKSS